jgi:pre-rRNA-processing protein TSR1
MSKSSIGSASGFHHRSSLKQSNKPFKGTTKAKASVSRGKIDQKTLVASNSSGPSTLSKADRKNQSKLKQLARKSELSELRKIFNGPDGVARTVALIPLTPSANVAAVLDGLYKGAGKDFTPTEPLYIDSFKQNVRFFCPDRSNLIQVIDTAAAVDTLLFVVSAKDECIDLLGVDLLEVLRAQGMCTAIACIQDLETVKTAKQHDLRLNWLDSLTYHLASTLHPRLFSLDHFENRRESIEMLRIISQLAVYEGISWRNVHPYLVAEKVELAQTAVKITGRVRGSRPFSVNQIVHIPGVGDFKLSKLTALPFKKRSNHKDMETESTSISLLPDPELQEELCDLVDLNVINEENIEQMQKIVNEAEAREKIMVRVPKGTSAYQARVIHEAGLDYASSESEIDVKAPLDNETLESSDYSEEEEEEELTDVDINEQEDSKREKEREEREAEEALQDYAIIKRRQLDEAEPLSKEFPDAVEVPEDQPARVRFAKYRGVESLRTSEWDTSADALPKFMENIFEFDNFKLSMKRALAVDPEELENSHFRPGTLIEMELSLANFSPDSPEAQTLLQILNRPSNQVPLCIYGLLAHEQKYSILNLNLQPRSTSVNVRSKEPVLMIYGFRRLEVSPIYSDASHGHNLHTMHRIMPTDRPCTASVLAPIAYPPTSVLFFRAKHNNEKVSLLASGSLESIKPNRIILKRITFIGYPFKIHRRTCTVRFMFFNPADVNWFRPVELVTSRQFRRGHIKESLGTHGYMKCIFDKQI